MEGEEEGVVTRSQPSSSTPQHHFVLVHGASHGAWCWYKLRQLLEDSGHRVSCFDLAGAGIHRSDPNTIFFFEEYDKPLSDFMSNLQESEKVILVGHSAGGHSVTHAIHAFSDKIALGVYVGATMLRSGFATQQDIKDGCPDLSDLGVVDDYTFGLGFDNPPTGVLMRKEFQRKTMYHLSPLEDSTLASMLLRPAPAMAFSRARFGGGGGDDDDRIDRVRRVYVKTTQDRVLKPEQQDVMIRRWPPTEVMSIESDHCPFFAAPAVLSSLLIEAALSHCSL